MYNNECDELKNITPKFTHIVHRVCTPSWCLDCFIDSYNFLFIYEGRVNIECNGKKHIGTKGDFIFLTKGDYVRAKTYKEDLMKCYAFNFFYTCPKFNQGTREWELKDIKLPFDFHKKIKDEYLFKKIIRLCDRLTNIWLSNKINSEVYLTSNFMEIISLLILSNSKLGINYEKVRKVEKVIDYFTINYSNKIYLEQLADELNISKSYLCRIFKEITNKTPIEYLMEIRINKAKQLILDGYKISECAEKVGFNDVYYFSKYFKKIEGLSPSIYKNSK